MPLIQSSMCLANSRQLLQRPKNSPAPVLKLQIWLCYAYCRLQISYKSFHVIQKRLQEADQILQSLKAKKSTAWLHRKARDDDWYCRLCTAHLKYSFKILLTCSPWRWLWVLLRCHVILQNWSTKRSDWVCEDTGDSGWSHKRYYNPRSATWRWL